MKQAAPQQTAGNPGQLLFWAIGLEGLGWQLHILS